ncbi:MAG: hypothetical protein JWM88_625 [Verrucomicrobia bacterium]|nr:hypothetical protein [Verrucomicrobiota bacterium]
MKTTPAHHYPGIASAPRFRVTIGVLLSVALAFSSCTVPVTKQLPMAQVAQPAQERILGVTLKDGTEVAFDPAGAILRGDRVEANVKGVPYSVSLADLQRLWVERREISAVRTLGLVVGVLGGGLLVALAMKQSCPFVYSWDGTHYVFDAEPYGGAITRGLEKDDFSELSHLREQDGEYRLLLTNEVDETQHTNLMELWVVDHAPGSRVVADQRGGLHAFKQIERPTAARDRYGKDLLPWLATTDKKIWEPESVPGPDGSLRQELQLTFAKPPGATQVNLIANAATGLWGSYMIKKMTELRGSEAGKFLAAIDRDPEAVKAVHAWAAREETYVLRIEVKEPTGWEVRGALIGSGPFLAEDRMIPLDISRVAGPAIELRMRPPVGFWAFNSFGAAYGPDATVPFATVAMKSARTTHGEDVLGDLARVDDKYYRMPEMTDRAEVTFLAPPRSSGMDRTVFLHSRGWYELHLHADGPPDQETLSMISDQPDGPAQFAVNERVKWQRTSQSK